jgi:SNF2 family DNA or RNA helicase
MVRSCYRFALINSYIDSDKSGTRLIYGRKKPESRPHLIVVPGHLAENWVNEIEAWAGGNLEVHQYTATLISRPDWFSQTSTSSAFQRSHFPAHRKVIIATIGVS